VLVLRPGALGDTLLAVPALRALRAAWPGAKLSLAAHAGAARLLARLGEVDVGWAFDDPGLVWLWRAGAVPAGDGGPDAVVAWLSDPERSLARRLAGLGVGRVLVAPSRPADEVTHCARFLADALAPLLGGRPDLDARPLAVEPVRSADVLVHPGSGAARKNWPGLGQTVRLLRAAGVPVRLVVGEADAEAAAAVDAACGGAIERLECPALERLAAELAGCRAYLGNDSGVSHLAGLVGAHTLALFGPTPAGVWRPLGPAVQVLPFGATPQAVASACLAALPGDRLG
jgi:heptosyltransferase III